VGTLAVTPAALAAPGSGAPRLSGREAPPRLWGVNVSSFGFCDGKPTVPSLH
jgi:hypothetical protein